MGKKTSVKQEKTPPNKGGKKGQVPDVPKKLSKQEWADKMKKLREKKKK